MTVQQLINACLKYKYILVRHENYGLVGMNCAIVNLTSLEKGPRNGATYIQGFIPCSFDQYLTHKNPFYES